MDLHIDAVTDHADGAVSIGDVQSRVMCTAKVMTNNAASRSIYVRVDASRTKALELPTESGEPAIGGDHLNHHLCDIEENPSPSPQLGRYSPIHL